MHLAILSKMIQSQSVIQPKQADSNKDITPKMDQKQNKQSLQTIQQIFKLKSYQITIKPLTPRTLSITAFDYALKIQFSQPNLTLQHIGTSTVIIALTQKNNAITITSQYKKQAQFQILQLHIKVQSLFLKTIQQTIYIKKSRNINQAQILQRKISNLSTKLKNIKLNNTIAMKGYNMCNIKAQEQYFSGASYQNLISINLPKGKYILTFSFLLKANNTWIYLYINQGQALMNNSGFYVPSGSGWVPCTVRKIYTVAEGQKQVAFTTNSASSYPVTLRNRLMTAQILREQTSQ